MKTGADKLSKGQPVKINCLQCKHYFVTWDPQFPRGCRSYGVKTSQMPSALVYRSSGQPCLTFEMKS
nr:MULTISPECIES: uracil-DNA glycosylase [unclassified Paenibacillus]